MDVRPALPNPTSDSVLRVSQAGPRIDVGQRMQTHTAQSYPILLDGWLQDRNTVADPSRAHLDASSPSWIKIMDPLPEHWIELE
jgi:hypothetical protein